MDKRSDDWVVKPRLLVVVVGGGGPILKVSTVIQPTGEGVGLFATLLGCSGFKGPFRALTISLES